MNKVFLGGTCAESTWREELIPYLDIPYFNPVVEDWTPECIENEQREKEICNIHLYVITSQMSGVYSIAEMVESVFLTGKETVAMVCTDGFNEGQIRSLKAVLGLLKRNGGEVYFDVSMKLLGDVINRIGETNE